MNTTITYIYRDAANYKANRCITVKGILTFPDIAGYLEDGVNFIPWDVGLEEIQADLRGFPGTDDHVWHELSPDEIAWNMCAVSEYFSAKELIRRFRMAHNRGWQIRAAMNRLGIK